MMPDSMAGLPRSIFVYFVLLIPVFFLHRFLCRLPNLRTRVIKYLCRVLPELVSLFADTSSENAFEDTFILPTYPS